MRSSLLSTSLRSSLLIDSGGNLQKLDELRGFPPSFLVFFFFLGKSFDNHHGPVKSHAWIVLNQVCVYAVRTSAFILFFVFVAFVFAQLTLSNINAQLFSHCDYILNGFILVSAEQRGVSERLPLHPKLTGACGDGRGTACLCNCDDKSCDLR